MNWAEIVTFIVCCLAIYIAVYGIVDRICRSVEVCAMAKLASSTEIDHFKDIIFTVKTLKH